MRKTAMILALNIATIVPAYAGEMVKLRGAGGVAAFVEGAADAKRGVLLVHDYFGISPATKAEAKRLADLGYRVVAVDLYKGASANNGKTAEKLMNTLDGEYAQSAVAAALAELTSRHARVAIVGYSMGGKIAIEGLLRNPQSAVATAAIYGGSFEDFDESKLKVVGPILLISGSLDGWSYPSLITMQERMQKLGNPIQTFVFPGADHGYAQPLFMEGKNLNRAAINATHAVVDQFLAAATAGSD